MRDFPINLYRQTGWLPFKFLFIAVQNNLLSQSNSLLCDNRQCKENRVRLRILLTVLLLNHSLYNVTVYRPCNFVQAVCKEAIFDDSNTVLIAQAIRSISAFVRMCTFAFNYNCRSNMQNVCCRAKDRSNTCYKIN